MNNEEATIEAENFVGVRVTQYANSNPTQARTRFHYQVEYIDTDSAKRKVTHVRPGTPVEYELFSALVTVLSKEE